MYKERQRDLGFSAWRREGKGWGPTATYLGERVGKMDPDLSWRSNSWRTKGNGCKLQQGKFWLDMRRNYFTMEVFRHWDRSPERMWDLHPWRHSKFDRNKEGNEQPHLHVPALSRRCDELAFRCPFQPVYHVALFHVQLWFAAAKTKRKS